MDDHLGAGSLARLLRGWREGAGPAVSAQAALAGRIATLLSDGRLAVGTRVPSERELAVALGVGRGTVAAAYQELREDGYLVRRRGSGTWTASPATPPAGSGPPNGAPLDGTLHVGPTGYSPFAPMGAPQTQDGGRAVIDLAHAAPWAPMEAMSEAAARALAELPTHLTSTGYDVLGLPALREAVAARLTAQGLRTSADEVMITAGAQHAHSLVTRTLVRPGDRVLIEQPTYPGAIDLCRHASARAVPVAMVEDPASGRPGWDLDALSAAMRAATPTLGYLVVDHQNPTGAVMSPETRAAVVAAAGRHGVALVVDDCLREMWLDTPVPPPLGAWAGAGGTPVITTGGLSKTVWGGLRIGWLRAPRTLLRRIAAARASDDISTPVLEQLVAVGLVERLDELVEASRQTLAHRRDHLRGALARALPEWRVPNPSGGFSLWVDLGVPRSSALVEAAARFGVHLAAGPRFATGGAFEQYLRLPYTLSPDALDDAVARLAEAWDSLGVDTPTLTTVV
ncbi:GntR family transcriptional regulator [Actinomycetospora succinea]|uniref:GntR family transcriptional regulator n=1 Tax=Actinomycetospora succinea TaxID=663603 RepID=A0A4R6ULY3_9PSEU|nr:PLP-dependent aminotransferase family protein [Actinomycetospora succinea]TDQ46165.1 GntR family transcriptional regulator [Actinomycetospora succinea]